MRRSVAPSGNSSDAAGAGFGAALLSVWLNVHLVPNYANGRSRTQRIAVNFSRMAGRCMSFAQAGRGTEITKFFRSGAEMS